MRVAALNRHPVKSFTPEPLQRVHLAAGAYFPGDRLFAVENGPTGFDPAAPVHRPKVVYLTLARIEALARLATRYDDETGTLVLSEGGRVVAEGDLATPEGRAEIEGFLIGFLGDALRGPPRVLVAPEGFRFTDAPHPYVSILNRASLAALEERIGAPVDPRRFRMNVELDGLAPFAELDLVGRALEAPSGLRLRIRERTVRCAATNVDPDTGQRDLAIPKTLLQAYGHSDCGIYAEIEAPGALAIGERLVLVEEGGGRERLPF